jgi:hypothetical protein
MTSEVVTIRLALPAALPADAVGEALRACLDRLGLVQGSATFDRARTLHVTAHWASDALPPLHHQCAEPGCRRYPAVRLDGLEWCARHGNERQREAKPNTYPLPQGYDL